MVERCKPTVEQTARGRIRNETHLISKAGQTNHDGRVNWADVVSPVAGHRCVGRIPQDDGVDLGRIVFIVVSRSACGWTCAGTARVGPAGTEMYMSAMAHGIKNR